jgi:hypothetical protein
MDKFTCELCAGDRFDAVFLTESQRTPLLACRQCRLVFAPRPLSLPPPAALTPAAPDLQRYGLAAARPVQPEAAVTPAGR